MNRFAKWLRELGGMKIWHPTHNDPRVKGPAPRILTRRQWEAMEKMRRERENEKVESVVHDDGNKGDDDKTAVLRRGGVCGSRRDN